MQIIEGLGEPRSDQDVVLTIGTFDGVHRGHQHLVGQLVERARSLGRLSCVLTFHPHPRAVLQPQSPPNYLSTISERASLLAALGLDILVLLPFTPELASMSAEAFARSLYDALHMRELWVGADFAMGKDRAGGAERLSALGQEIGFALRIIKPLYEGGEPISSTRIRALLAEGDVAGAARLLGRGYAVTGPVVHGAQRGRTIGFPTANVAVPDDRAIPAYGVYAVWAHVGERALPGVANIGVRPSFDNGARSLEVFLLDFQGDLYGAEMRVEFVERLRPEKKFDDVAELVRQMGHDVQEARMRLQALGAPRACATD